MRYVLMLALVGLVGCGGDECEHEIESARGVSMCMPESKDELLCVVDPQGEVPEQCLPEMCPDLLVFAYYGHTDAGPRIIDCVCGIRESDCDQTHPRDFLDRFYQ